MSVADLREKFQRDDEIDKMEWDELARIIKDVPQTYTAEEDILINKVHAKLGMLEWGHFEELESPDHLVKMGKISIEGGGVGRASVTVDASMEECAAWEIAKMNREQVRDAGSLERSFTKTNDHHGVYHVVYDFKIPGFQPREFLSSLVWRQQGDKLVVLYDDVEHTDFPVYPSLVRATTTIYFEYVRERISLARETCNHRCTHSRNLYSRCTDSRSLYARCTHPLNLYSLLACSSPIKPRASLIYSRSLCLQVREAAAGWTFASDQGEVHAAS